MAGKGQPKTPGSGRQKGTRNKRSIEVDQLLRDLNCDPFEGMARLAQKAESEGDNALAGRMYSELAKYLKPQKKAVEHTGDIDNKIEFVTTVR